MAANESLQSMKSSFYEEFDCVVALKHGDNQSYMNNEQYLKFIEDVKTAKKATKRTTLQYRRLKRFDVCNIGDIEKLIVPVSGTENLKYYVKNEDLFDVLHDIHLSIGHGGRNRMIVEAKNKYANVTQEAILLYLRLCKPCQVKQKSMRKNFVVKPILSNEMNSHCQVDFIDMQTNPDGNFKFILVYRDHFTKFIQLRPLQSKTAEEVSKVLLDIFCIFGAPLVLQFDNGREFANPVVESLTQMWPGLKIIYEKPCHSQSQSSANQDVQSMLMTWIIDKKCEKWSEGLRFIQFMKNRDYHHGVKTTPYHAMFGCDVKVGLRSLVISSEAIENIESKEDLEKMLNQTMLECDTKVGLRSSVLPSEAMENIENKEDLEKFLKKLKENENAIKSETIAEVNERETVEETDCELCDQNRN